MMLRIPFAALIAFLFAGLMSAPLAQQPARAVAIDDDDIGGVVTSAKGPEAGVWVIAENDRPGYQVPEDRRHRRRGALRGA